MSAYKELGKAISIVREIAPTGDQVIDDAVRRALERLRDARELAEEAGE